MSLTSLSDASFGPVALAAPETVEFIERLFAYAGFAHRAETGLAWEIGATAVHFGEDSRYDYGELFAGLIEQRWNARLYLSPSYFGSGEWTAYAELNGGTPLDSAWRLFAHAGALARVGGGADDYSRRVRFDLRVGVSTSMGPWELQLAWAAATRGGFYPIAYAGRRSAWLLSATFFF